MIDWAARARTQILETAYTPTAKTDETPLSSVSSVAPSPILAKRCEVSSVSSVGGGTVSEKASLTKACSNCRHRTVHSTCREPVAAGLSKRFKILWPDPGHGATCPAWKRDPYEAQTLVHIEAARRQWTAAERDAWLADADDNPGAVADALRPAA